MVKAKIAITTSGQTLSVLKVLLLILSLWLMLWAGLLTDLGDILTLNSLGDLKGFLKSVRALMPFIAGILALSLILLNLRTIRSWLISPLGLLTLYGFLGVISSLLLSPQPATGLYWSALYLCVLLVLWVFLSDTQALSRIQTLIHLNWAIVASILGVIFVMALLSGTFASDSRLSGFIPWLAPKEVYGEYGINANGVGRFAAITALVVLTRFHSKLKKTWIIALIALLALSLTMLSFTQSRTGLVAFLVAVGLLLWFPFPRLNKILTLVGVLFLLLLTFYTPFPRISSFPAGEPQPMPGSFASPLLSWIDELTSGRLSIWRDGLHLVQGSPLLGFGFQADRLLLEGRHMHNAFMQALVQTGALGTIAFVAALVWGWIYLFRLGLWHRFSSLDARHRIPLMEIALIFVFLSVRAITESTGAFFGIDLLLLAPLLVFIQTLGTTRSTNLLPSPG